MAPKPPLSGRVDMVLLRPPFAPSLLPSASWLPEGHLSNVHINGLSASMANSLISHNTAWNSAPRTVLREGTEVMGKNLGFKAHPLHKAWAPQPPFIYPQSQPGNSSWPHTGVRIQLIPSSASAPAGSSVQRSRAGCPPSGLSSNATCLRPPRLL